MTVDEGMQTGKKADCRYNKTVAIENLQRFGRAAPSQEQAKGVDQVNTAVSSMDKVVQQAAANAEELASASEEMSAQVAQMKGYVEELDTIIAGGGHKPGALMIAH